MERHSVTEPWKKGSLEVQVVLSPGTDLIVHDVMNVQSYSFMYVGVTTGLTTSE